MSDSKFYDSPDIVANSAATWNSAEPQTPIDYLLQTYARGVPPAMSTGDTTQNVVSPYVLSSTPTTQVPSETPQSAPQIQVTQPPTVGGPPAGMAQPPGRTGVTPVGPTVPNQALPNVPVAARMQGGAYMPQSGYSPETRAMGGASPEGQPSNPLADFLSSRGVQPVTPPKDGEVATSMGNKTPDQRRKDVLSRLGKGPVGIMTGLAALAAALSGNGANVLPILGAGARGAMSREQEEYSRKHDEEQQQLQQYNSAREGQGQEFNQNMETKQFERQGQQIGFEQGLGLMNAQAQQQYKQAQALHDNTTAGLEVMRWLGPQQSAMQQSWVDNASDDQLKSLGMSRGQFYDKGGSFIPLKPDDPRFQQFNGKYRDSFWKTMQSLYNANDPTNQAQEHFLMSQDPQMLLDAGIDPNQFYTFSQDGKRTFAGLKAGYTDHQANQDNARTATAGAAVTRADAYASNVKQLALTRATKNVMAPGFAYLPADEQRAILNQVDANMKDLGYRAKDAAPLPLVTPKMTIAQRLQAMGINEKTRHDLKIEATGDENAQTARMRVAIAQQNGEVDRQVKLAKTQAGTDPNKYYSSVQQMYVRAQHGYQAVSAQLSDPLKDFSAGDRKNLQDQQNAYIASMALLRPKLDAAGNLLQDYKYMQNRTPAPVSPNGETVRPLPTPGAPGQSVDINGAVGQLGQAMDALKRRQRK